MDTAALITVLLLWGDDGQLVLADAFHSFDECWAALTSQAKDGQCVSEAPPVEMLTPPSRPADLCRPAPCRVVRPPTRNDQ
jgi:hypothetical protein